MTMRAFRAGLYWLVLGLSATTLLAAQEQANQHQDNPASSHIYSINPGGPSNKRNRHVRDAQVSEMKPLEQQNRFLHSLTEAEKHKLNDTHFALLSTGHKSLNKDTRDKLWFTDDEKLRLVDAHNVLRRLEKSSDMSFMIWDKDLEVLAQEWAENCDFKHRPDRKNVGKFKYAGENLFAGSGEYDPVIALVLWHNETLFYDYNTMDCTPGEMCGHYTQMVWAGSLAMGCGVAYCPELRSVSFNGWHLACNYGPGGNVVGVRPFQKGNACNSCKNEFCVDGLCSEFPVIEA